MRANEFIFEAPLTLDQQISDVVDRLDELEDLIKKQDQTPEEEQEFIRLNKKLEQLQQKKKEQKTTKVQDNPRQPEKPKNPNKNLLEDIRKYISMDLKGTAYFDDIDRFIRTLPRIKRDCQPYLKQVKDIYGMYRGLELSYGKKPLVVSKTARLKNRSPKDTDIRFHIAINEFFNKKFGHPYRNGVFVTGDEHQAAQYGDIFSIFPVGDFDFLWSPDVDDMTQHFDITTSEFHNERFKPTMKKIEETNWKTDDLNAATKSKNEIMLWTPKYYAINFYVIDDRSHKLITKYLKS